MVRNVEIRFGVAIACYFLQLTKLTTDVQGRQRRQQDNNKGLPKAQFLEGFPLFYMGL